MGMGGLGGLAASLVDRFAFSRRPEKMDRRRFRLGFPAMVGFLGNLRVPRNQCRVLRFMGVVASH